MTSTTAIGIAQILVPFIFTGILFAAKSWFVAIIDKRIEPMQETVTLIHTSLEHRNGGSSVRDQLVFIREDVGNLTTRIDAHLLEHSKPARRKTP